MSGAPRRRRGFQKGGGVRTTWHEWRERLTPSVGKSSDDLIREASGGRGKQRPNRSQEWRKGCIISHDPGANQAFAEKKQTSERPSFAEADYKREEKSNL